MNGPIAHDALLSLALPSSSALRPSKSRRLTSLPSVAPTVAPAAVDREHDLRLRIVPLRLRMDADVGARADRRHRLRLGEDLGVGTDADLEILRPHALRDQRVLEPRRLGRAWPHARQIVADDRDRSRWRTDSAFAGSPRACSSITRSSMLDDERDAGRLERRRSQGARNHGACSSRPAAAELASASAVDAIRGNSPHRRTAVAASGRSRSSLIVGATRERSNTSSAVMRTRTGPATSGRQRRPTSSARA